MSLRTLGGRAGLARFKSFHHFHHLRGQTQQRISLTYKSKAFGLRKQKNPPANVLHTIKE
ncbi:hypothetical protein IRJ41_016845 [Triplophysa rosa]|uniref:Uncharacterized protein n=1 Tax=Triplophysa rosa TaxID=992332 RepID=A0A9W7TF55_TRIRA|nr:hypothetical protein IRJ41_016845 [Triplophysa rosa]